MGGGYYNRKVGYATYSLPETIIEKVEPQSPPPQDDFKPLATLELDGWELVDEKGEKWITYPEISKHLGYANDSAVRKIYSDHQTWFNDGVDTTLLRLVTPSRGEQEFRLFSFTGGLKICRYSEMPKADEVMQQLIDLADKIRRGEYPAKVSHIDEHIAKWQDSLMLRVIKPAIVDLDERKADREEVKTAIDDVKSSIIHDVDKASEVIIKVHTKDMIYRM